MKPSAQNVAPNLTTMYRTETAAARGATMMRGTYSPTARNGQVATFFADRGFTLLESDGNVTRWEADLAERPLAAPEWIVLRRLEEE